MNPWKKENAIRANDRILTFIEEPYTKHNGSRSADIVVQGRVTVPVPRKVVECMFGGEILI
jgi:hypothetical protein